jgi:hypothetical protein
MAEKAMYRRQVSHREFSAVTVFDGGLTSSSLYGNLWR